MLNEDTKISLSVFERWNGEIWWKSCVEKLKIQREEAGDEKRRGGGRRVR